MTDFESLQWCKHHPEGETARAMRRDVRRHRRQRGRDGHRFRFETLKTLWVSGGVHAVLNHRDDPAWQHWHFDEKDGWDLVGCHLTRRAAQAAAEAPLARQREDEPRPVEPGLYVDAGWPQESRETAYKIRVRCHSASIAADIAAVFENIGCAVREEIVTI